MARDPFKKLLNNVHMVSEWLIEGGDSDNPSHWRNPKSSSYTQRHQLIRKQITPDEITDGETSKYRATCSHKQLTMRIKYCYLQVDDLKRQWKNQGYRCAWSGMQLDPMCILESRNPFSLSVDRIDDSRDYLYDNIMISSRFMNYGRGSASIKNTKTFLIELANHFQSIDVNTFEPGMDHLKAVPPPIVNTLF